MDFGGVTLSCPEANLLPKDLGDEGSAELSPLLGAAYIKPPLPWRTYRVGFSLGFLAGSFLLALGICWENQDEPLLRRADLHQGRSCSRDLPRPSAALLPDPSVQLLPVTPWDLPPTSSPAPSLEAAGA